MEKKRERESRFTSKARPVSTQTQSCRNKNEAAILHFKFPAVSLRFEASKRASGRREMKHGIRPSPRQIKSASVWVNGALFLMDDWSNAGMSRQDICSTATMKSKSREVFSYVKY